MSATAMSIEVSTVDSSWKSIPLGELVEVLDNKRKPITKRDRIAGPYPYYGATGALDWVSAFLFDEPLVLIGEDGAKWAAGNNSAFPISGKTWVNNHAHVLRPRRDRVLDDWLIYYLNATDLSDFISGMTVPKLNQGRLREIPVPLPPLDEQKRIIAVLDQAFAALDRARVHAEANLADCRKLFAVAVSAMVKRKANNQQQKLRLGSIVTRLTNGYVGPIKDVYVESGIPYLLARQVRDNTLAFDGRTYITQEFNDKHKKSKLKAGDVLLVQSGHIGHSAMVPDEHEGHNCHAMIVLTPVDEIVSGSYLSALFNTPEMQDTFQNIRTGSTVPHLTCKMVKELLIELPPRSVQDEIIQEIYNLRARIEIAKQRYKTDAGDVANLRQSLLQKAFSGDLT